MTIRNASTIRPHFLRAIRLVAHIMLDAKRRVGSMPTLRSPRLVAGLVVAFLLSSLLMPANGIFSRGTRASAFDETIATFQSSDCTTPKAEWNLGQTACAVATDAVGDKRIAWVAPDGTVADLTDFFSGTTSDTYTFETSGPLAQVGTWQVTLIDPSGVVSVEAAFVVKDPNNLSADLSLSMFGPTQVAAGSDAVYRLELTNKGPDDATTVALTNAVPANTTFVSEAQNSGPSFTCTNPTAGSGTGTTNCTIASLPAGNTAIFTLVFKVNTGTPSNTEISNTASVSSTTGDPHDADNTASSSTLVGTTSSCTIICPASITVPNDSGQCGAIVSYPTPTTTGECATDPEGGGSGVVTSPPSGSFFPVGTTTVTATTISGGFCSFTVTVNPTNPVPPGCAADTTPPTITCPANITVSLPANSTANSMVVNYPAVTATDDNPGVTVTSAPASGSVFAVGTTTVEATATDAAGNTSSCSFTVTVLYNFTGFFSPVDNLPTLNIVNAGRAIPVKFSLSGNKGLNIFAIGNPTSGEITCPGGTPVEVEETVTAGNSSLSYNAGSDQYNYVWATDPSWAGTCRQFVIVLSDGSVHVANFKFR